MDDKTLDDRIKKIEDSVAKLTVAVNMLSKQLHAVNKNTARAKDTSFRNSELIRTIFRKLGGKG